MAMMNKAVENPQKVIRVEVNIIKAYSSKKKVSVKITKKSKNSKISEG